MSAFRQARCGLQQTSPAKVICFDASPDFGPEFGTVAGKGLGQQPSSHLPVMCMPLMLNPPPPPPGTDEVSPPFPHLNVQPVRLYAEVELLLVGHKWLNHKRVHGTSAALDGHLQHRK